MAAAAGKWLKEMGDGRFRCIWRGTGFLPICRDIGTVCRMLDEPTAFANAQAKADIARQGPVGAEPFPNAKILLRQQHPDFLEQE
jgi:hypothetical protein